LFLHVFFLIISSVLFFYLIYLFRDLQKGYLDVLTWLVRMESSITTDDTNGNALMNDVLKKTSLLIGVCN